MKKLTLLAICLSLVTSGCASLKSVSLTQIPAERSKRISAEASDWGILGLFGNNDFTQRLPEELQKQCPNGRVTGILTKQDSYFYFFWLTRRVTAHGFCVTGGKV